MSFSELVEKHFSLKKDFDSPDLKKKMFIQCMDKRYGPPEIL